MAVSMSILAIIFTIASVLGAPGGWHYRTHNWKPISKPAPRTPIRKPTILEAAVATPQLSTLVTAVQAAGLVDTLNGKGPFTVFAPNNDAFAKIPADTLVSLLEPENVDQLKAVLLRHVLPTVIKAGDIPEGSTTVRTAGGETITVINSDGVTIESSAGKANVIATDVVTSNGVVHIVDTVF
jgi:uncharacterized surface protein with fasciclin (FAS1) repeats